MKGPSRFSFPFPVACILIAGAFGTAARALPENRAAWKLLLDNKPREARSAFDHNRDDKNPAVAGEACRGLAITARYLGRPLDETRWACEAFLRDKDTLALMAGIVRLLHFRDQWGGHDIRAAYDLGNGFFKKPSLATAGFTLELANRYVNDGEASKASAILDKQGLVRDWWLIGPFSNISGSGFDQAYPPESAVELGRSYAGKNGNPVAWAPIHSTSPASWIFSQNHCPAANAVLYYASQVESPVERKAFLGFGASGSFKVFLNDRLVLAERQFRNTGVDVYLQEVTLRKGANRILVKLGNEERYSNFLLRFAGADGRGLSDLKPVKPEGAYPKEPGAAANPASTPTVDREAAYLRDRLAKDPGDEDAALLMVDLDNAMERTDSAEVFALARLERNPRSALWQSSLAEAMGRSGQVTRAEEYLKAAYRNSPECYSAWLQELRRLSASAGAEAVLDFLAKSPEEHRGRTTAQLASMAKLAELGQRAEAIKVLARIEAQPDFDEEVAVFLSSVYQSRGQKKESLKIWNKLLKYHRGSVSIYLAIAGQLFKAGDVDDAEDVLKDGLKLNPDNPNLPMALANAALQRKDYGAADRYADAALALAPTNPGLLGLKATVQTLAGKTDAARQALKKSVQANYNDFPSWDRLRKLDGAPTFEELAPLPSVDSLVKASAGWEGLKRERGAVLSFIQDVFFYPSRAVRRRIFLVAHLPTQEAVNAWKEYAIACNPTYQTLSVTRAYARKAAGNEVDAEVRGRGIVFKALEPGDCIVIEWILKDDYDGEMARQAWGIGDFSLGVPAFDSRLRLFMPADGDTIGYTVRGREVKTEAADRAGARIRIFTRGPYVVPVDFKYVPMNDETSPDVLYSTFPDWGRISDWYANLTENKTAPSPILRRLADSLFRGERGEAVSDAEKIARVHRYVSNNVAYSSLPFRQSGWVPQTAQEALASRLGDCKDKAALAKSLLDLAGVESHLVLVATRDEFGTRPGPVGPHFNHCILAYLLGGKERYMDLTDPNLFWRSLPRADQGAVALVVRRGNRDLIRLPEDAPAGRRIERNMTCALGDTGDAALESRTLRTGVFAGGQRENYRFLSEEERRRNMRETLAGDYPEVTLDSVWFGSLEPDSDTLRYGYRYRSRRAVKFSGDTRIFHLDIPDKLASDNVPQEGPHPEGIDLFRSFYHLGSFQLSGTVTFPARWRLLSVPAPVRIKSPYGNYELVFKLKGKALTYTRKADFAFAEAVPAAETEKVRSFLNRIVQSDDVQLVFKGM